MQAQPPGPWLGAQGEHQGKQEGFPHGAGSDPPPGSRAGGLPVCPFPPAEHLQWETARLGSMISGEVLELIPPLLLTQPSPAAA